MAAPKRHPITSADKAARMSVQGRAFQAARRAAGLSQSDAAAAWGVKLDTLRAWERGRRSIPADARRRAIEKWGADPIALTDTCPTCGRAL